MEPILELDKVCKAFGGVKTTQKVSFQLYGGEILGLIGPNGAGKTTLLNLISGIYDCDAGNIVMCGKDVTKAPSHVRAGMGLARTFQSPRFLQRSTIRDNLLLGTDLADQMGFVKSFLHRKGTDFNTNVTELLDIAQLELDWESEISGLPYGKQKLLEIVRSLLTQPKIMLVDEPAAGLNRHEMERVTALMRYAVQKGIGVILIEHAMDLVMNLCDRIMVLNFGEMIAIGTPEEISMDPTVIEAYLGSEEEA